MVKRDNPIANEASAFSDERSLQESLARRCLTPCSCSTTMVRREVPMGEIIPDLVYVGFQSRPDRDLWPKRWTFRHSFIVMLLRRRHSLGLRTIACLCFDTEDRIVPLLNDLQESGAIIQSDSGTYRLSHTMNQVNACVVAVETKLKRWREALGQAKVYRRFADESVVVMSGNNVPDRDKDLESFRYLGVGLCRATPRNLLRIVEPRRTPVVAAEKEYLVGSAARDGQTLWSCL